MSILLDVKREGGDIRIHNVGQLALKGFLVGILSSMYFPMVYWIRIHATIFFIVLVNHAILCRVFFSLFFLSGFVFGMPECPNPPLLVNQQLRCWGEDPVVNYRFDRPVGTFWKT